jgi:hypothetical protein
VRFPFREKANLQHQKILPYSFRSEEKVIFQRREVFVQRKKQISNVGKIFEAVSTFHSEGKANLQTSGDSSKQFLFRGKSKSPTFGDSFK